MTAKNVKTIAMDYVVQVLKSAARSGVSIPELLVQVGIERERLEDACARVDRATFLRLLLTVMEQTGDEFIGFGQGRRSKPGTFSMMAHAVINCANLKKQSASGRIFLILLLWVWKTRCRKKAVKASLQGQRLITMNSAKLVFKLVFL